MNRMCYISTVVRHGADILRSPGMQKSRLFIQHGSTSVFAHSVNVALECVYIVRTLGLDVDERSLVRGALLHDYFLYDWHDHAQARPNHATAHGLYALENARRDFGVGPVESDMIAKHMFPLTPGLPRYRETWILCAADKVVALRETASGVGERMAG